MIQQIIKVLRSKKILLTLPFIGVLLFIKLSTKNPDQAETSTLPWLKFQSIDTMKYSRDIAREKLKDIAFDQTIDLQVKNIASTGATHVAIGTPYDEEFLPFLQRWVRAARKYKLNVWFRGNWSGWEGWFEYPKITKEEHLEKTKQFILSNKNLFEDGDIFTACPECENGGPGDPRRTGEIAAHRDFLITQYRLTNEAFLQIGKQVHSNINSMNGDVARLIMDKDTTKALGGIVVIDHYVASVDTLVNDIKTIAAQSEGKVVLGEFGAPINDIHGFMTPNAQEEWISSALNKLANTPELIGLNYWTNVGSSTQLWDSNGYPRPAVEAIRYFYTPKVISGVVKHELARPILSAKVSTSRKEIVTNKRGEFFLPVIPTDTRLTVTAAGFSDQQLTIDNNTQNLSIVLVKEELGAFWKLRVFIHKIFGIYL